MLTCLVILLTLTAAQAQNNVTCCAKSYVSQVYNALLGVEFQYGYDANTGNSLMVNNDLNVSIYTESATGRVYSHFGSSCTYEEFAELKNQKSCVQEHATFVGQDIRDGVRLYGWFINMGSVTGSVAVDDDCIPRLSFATFNRIPRVSRVLQNVQTDVGDLVIKPDFDICECIRLHNDP